MYTGQVVFAQLMAYLPLHKFRRLVKRYRGNHKVKTFSCLDQYLCMAFAQLTYRENLRDIEVCLRSVQPKLGSILFCVGKFTLRQHNIHPCTAKFN